MVDKAYIYYNKIRYLNKISNFLFSGVPQDIKRKPDNVHQTMYNDVHLTSSTDNYLLMQHSVQMAADAYN